MPLLQSKAKTAKAFVGAASLICSSVVARIELGDSQDRRVLELCVGLDLIKQG
jgi:hypothetical protein